MLATELNYWDNPDILRISHRSIRNKPIIIIHLNSDNEDARQALHKIYTRHYVSLAGQITV